MNIADYLPFLSDLPDGLQIIILNLILLLLALIAIWVLRNLITRIVMAPVKRFTTKTETLTDDKVLEAVERPMRILVLGIGLALIAAIFRFGPELDTFTNTLARALVIAALIFFVYNLVDIIGVTSENLHRISGLHIEARLLPFMRVVVKVFVVIMGLLIIVQEFGYNITGLVASFGVVGLAFSLAAQDTAANVFGFTAIVSDNPFEVGDYIITGDVAGTVEKVGVRSTRIRKLDQSLVTLPNSTLTDAAVTNWSRLEKRRLDFYIGITYDTTSAQMRAVLEALREMLKARETIDEETVIVHFVEFANSSLNIRIIAYVLIADWAEYTAETEQVNLAIMEVVEEHGLSMAFPSTSLYVESWPQQEQVKPVKSAYEATKMVETEHDDEAIETGKSEATYQDNPAASSDVDDGDSGER